MCVRLSKIMNNKQQLTFLKKEVIRLKQALKEKDKALNKCIKQSSKKMSQKDEQQKSQKNVLEKQNEQYNHYKICEANWVKIPEGLFYHVGHEDIPEVKIASFEMLTTPVTFEMYDRFCADTHQQPPSDNGWGRENRPVININYQNAKDYAQWLSKQTGWHCQLPSEEQWEYACRANTVTHYWYGDTPDPRMMVMATGKTMPTPGHRLANPWALYDMHGNVWEWTSSFKGDDVILCGGSWYNKANWLTSNARNISYPDFCNNNWGFRILRIKSVI